MTGTINTKELATQADTLSRRAAALWVDQERAGFYGHQNGAEMLDLGMIRNDDDRQRVQAQNDIIFSSVVEALRQSYLTHAPNGRRPSEQDAANAWVAIQKALPDSPELLEARQALTGFITTMSLVPTHLERKGDRKTIEGIAFADQRLRDAMTGVRFELGEDAFLADLMMMGIERERHEVKAQARI